MPDKKPEVDLWFMPVDIKRLFNSERFLRLSPAQKGFYLILMFQEWWEGGKGLPDDSFVLWIKSMCNGWIDQDDREWTEFVAQIDTLFPVSDDGRRHNEVVVETMHEKRNRIALASENAKNAAKARWDKEHERQTLEGQQDTCGRITKA